MLSGFTIENRHILQATQMNTFNNLSYNRRVIYLILFFSLIRLLLANVYGLANDEAYYWLYSQHMQWSYFDHPPMVAVWIRLFTFNLHLQQVEGFIRLGSIISFALSAYIIYQTTTLLKSEKAGWYAACMYTASFYAGIIAGIFILPDSPQMLFWTFSMWMIARITRNEQNTWSWILLGVSAGLCIMSKVHGVFIWLGILLFVITNKRDWLLKPQFYLALVVTLAIASPILCWNIQNHFVTYRFHSERVEIHQFSIDIKSFAKEVLGQLFFNNPFNVIVVILGCIALLRRKLPQAPALKIYLFTGFALSFTLLFISLFRSTLPHWSGPAYVSLFPIAAIYLAGEKRKTYTRLPVWALSGHIAFLVGWYMVVNHFPGTVGSKNKYTLGEGDITLDMYDWKEAGRSFINFYRNDVKNGRMPEETPVVCYTWREAHLEYYFCQPGHIQMFGLGTMNDLHDYMWTNKIRVKSRPDMNHVYCIVPSDEYYDFRRTYSGYYNSFDSATVIHTFRGGKPAHSFYVYRLHGWKGHIPMAE
jgi:hypothetical protein